MRAHLIVDGYNVLNCWPELLRLNDDLAYARDKLVQMLMEYGAYEKYYVSLVFDALYTRSEQSVEQLNKYFEVVYTKKKETADSYIERLAYESVRKGREVFVVTSDSAEQSAILGAGAYRMTAKELRRYVRSTKKILRSDYIAPSKLNFQRNELANRLDDDVLSKLEKLRRQ